jgi:hypothetical protein
METKRYDNQGRHIYGSYYRCGAVLGVYTIIPIALIFHYESDFQCTIYLVVGAVTMVQAKVHKELWITYSLASICWRNYADTLVQAEVMLVCLLLQSNDMCT